MSEQYIGGADLGRQEGRPPRFYPDLFFRGILDDSRCVIVGGRRLIPKSYIPEIHRIVAALETKKANRKSQRENHTQAQPA